MEKKIVRVPQGAEARASAHLSGRYIMRLRQGGHKKISAKLNAAGMPAASVKPTAAPTARALPHGSHFILPKLGFIVIDPHSAHEEALLELARQEDDIHALTPEGTFRIASASPDYVRGWRDATVAFADNILAADGSSRARIADVDIAAGPDFATALSVTGVSASNLTGDGIRIAILDTGFDMSHPDFDPNRIQKDNLVGDGTEFHDYNGHGTHCTGLAAGPRTAAQGPRYGIAYESSLYLARVLNDDGTVGLDATVMQGIENASGNCAVISLSIEASWSDGQPLCDSEYESVINRATKLGSLVVVAAGNQAKAVGIPGNSPSALTVAAVDQSLATASFSNRAMANAPGVKAPDLAAPGVGMRSSWLTSQGTYRSLSGTSQATAFVAGIAALWAQSNENLRGFDLKDALIKSCRQLANAAARKGEIGAGLVQAP